MIQFYISEKPSEKLPLAQYVKIRDGEWHQQTKFYGKRFHIHELGKDKNGYCLSIHYDEGFHREGRTSHLRYEVRRIKGCKDSLAKKLLNRQNMKIKIGNIFSKPKRQKRDRILFRKIERTFVDTL